MKAATQKCTSARPTHTGMPRRHAAAHLPKRQACAQAAATPPSDEAPRLTLDDGPAPAPRHDVAQSIPRVLLIDRDSETAAALTSLLMPEAQVLHAASCMEAKRLLDSELFSLVIIDPSLPDGNASGLLSAISVTPLLVYSAREPIHPGNYAYLPKPWTTPRQLWSTISTLLGIAQGLTAGD
ncbi:MAG: response regulator [Gammaproteobacteria bacterium]